MTMQQAVLNFHYKPGYEISMSLERLPHFVLLHLVTPPMPIIGTGLMKPITVNKVLPLSVLQMPVDQADDLLIGLVTFWERHEMDEWLKPGGLVSDEDHSIDMVNERTAYRNLQVLQLHARWFKDAPRPYFGVW